jgi:hypothetical protein
MPADIERTTVPATPAIAVEPAPVAAAAHASSTGARRPRRPRREQRGAHGVGAGRHAAGEKILAHPVDGAGDALARGVLGHAERRGDLADLAALQEAHQHEVAVGFFQGPDRVVEQRQLRVGFGLRFVHRRLPAPRPLAGRPLLVTGASRARRGGRRALRNGSSAGNHPPATAGRGSAPPGGRR